MFADLLPQRHEAVIRAKLREAIAERRRIEARKAELQSDPHLAEAVATYRQARERMIREAAERLKAHKIQCDADAVELSKLERSKRTHPAAVELAKLATEADHLARDIGVVCRENDIDPQTIEGDV